MADRQSKITKGVYSSSMPISMMAMAAVGALEVFMLVYTVVDPSLFGIYIGQYRMFYVTLLTLAVVYIALNFYVKKDVDNRFSLLNIVNPVWALLIFAWSLGITYFDAAKYGTVDSMVFMTFSLTVPLIFYLAPPVYAAIALVADAAMLYLTATVLGSPAPLINLSIFFIFQLVLGLSFLRLKRMLAERIVQEQENADVDIMTGFPNRRVYDADMKRFKEEGAPDDLIYMAVDINGLKEANDTLGHEAGDKLIVGSAQCLEKCFGDKGQKYRIGGDEFVVITRMGHDELMELLSSFEQSTRVWSEESGITLSISYGYARRSEFPDDDIVQLAREADKRMYAAKSQYYKTHGKDRRRYLSEGEELVSSSFTS